MDLLGITYNFKEGLLMVTETRRATCIFCPEVLSCLEKQRSYEGSWRSGSPEITEPLRRALKMWLLLLHTNNTPRMLYGRQDPRPADVLVFSDGVVPDPRPWVKDEWRAPRVGWVSFSRATSGTNEAVHFSSYTVPERQSLPPRTQIVLVELSAAVLALDQLPTGSREKSFLLFVDREPAESALIKGYSVRGDMCDLVAYFWDVVATQDHSVFVTCVPSDGNPSDGPSRAVFNELRSRGASWRTLVPLLV